MSHILLSVLSLPSIFFKFGYLASKEIILNRDYHVFVTKLDIFFVVFIFRLIKYYQN